MQLSQTKRSTGVQDTAPIVKPTVQQQQQQPIVVRHQQPGEGLIHAWIALISFAKLFTIYAETRILLSDFLPIELNDLIKEFGLSTPSIGQLIKPMIAITMGVYILFKSTSSSSRAFKQFMIIAMFFCAAGDIYLSLADDYFLNGLISFSVAHVAFMIGFFENSSFDNDRFLNYALPLGVIVTAIMVPMYRFLTSQDGFPQTLRIPVFVYMILIGTMAFAAALRDKTSQRSYFLGLTGAISFLVSDGILSVSVFVPGTNQYILSLALMFFYYLALELIFAASLAHFDHLKAVEPTTSKLKDD